QPQSNVNLSTSPTWLQAYITRSQAQALANFGGVLMPYRDCKQSDPALLPQFTVMYRQVRDGALPPNMMPHLPAVNLSGEQFLRDRTLLPRAGLDARGILNNACIHCHNSNLNQNITRARFNAQDLTRNTIA